MNLKFFEKNGMTDTQAINAGVYRIRIQLKQDESKSLTLYIGESYSMIARCGQHVYNVFKDDPAYFGLSDEHLTNEDLEMVFEVCEVVDVPKGISNSERDSMLQDVELKKIQQEKPLSQNSTNDNLRKDRVKVVAEHIDKLLKKE